MASAPSRIALMASRAPSRRLNRLGRGCGGGVAADCTEDAADVDDFSARLAARAARGACDSSAGVCAVCLRCGQPTKEQTRAQIVVDWGLLACSQNTFQCMNRLLEVVLVTTEPSCSYERVCDIHEDTLSL